MFFSVIILVELTVRLKSIFKIFVGHLMCHAKGLGLIFSMPGIIKYSSSSRKDTIRFAQDKIKG